MGTRSTGARARWHGVVYLVLSVGGMTGAVLIDYLFGLRVAATVATLLPSVGGAFLAWSNLRAGRAAATGQPELGEVADRLALAVRTRSGRRYDVVLDLVANHGISGLRRVLLPGGTLVLASGGSPGRFLGAIGLIVKGPALSLFVRQRLRPLVGPAPSKEVLTTLRELAEAGKLAPVIDRTYALAEAPEAIRYLEVEHARGKVVVTV